MKKENFLDLLKRGSPKELSEYLVKKGKKKKSIDPLIFNTDKPSEKSK